jgi:hypothetical protein
MSILDKAREFHSKQGHKDARISKDHLKLALAYCKGEITGVAVQHALGLKGANGSQTIGLILVQAVRLGWLVMKEKS